MHLKLEKPLVVFDLETTGIRVTLDRIVEYSFIKWHPNGEKELKNGRINPEMHIPAEASHIHGLYDKDVKEEPTFKEVAEELDAFLTDCDLAGFNILKFDVPVLVEEFLRAEIDFDIKGRRLLDAQRIFHIMEKRNLTAAYKFYCQKDLKGAHGAEADAMATLEVLDAQVKRYEGQEATDMQGEKIALIENDVDALHNLSSSKSVDLANRMVFNKDGVEVFNFGKYKGKPVAEILEREPNFYDWMVNGDFPLDTKRHLTAIRLRSFNKKFSSKSG